VEHLRADLRDATLAVQSQLRGEPAQIRHEPDRRERDDPVDEHAQWIERAAEQETDDDEDGDEEQRTRDEQRDVPLGERGQFLQHLLLARLSVVLVLLVLLAEVLRHRPARPEHVAEILGEVGELRARGRLRQPTGGVQEVGVRELHIAEADDQFLGGLAEVVAVLSGDLDEFLVSHPAAREREHERDGAGKRLVDGSLSLVGDLSRPVPPVEIHEAARADPADHATDDEDGDHLRWRRIRKRELAGEELQLPGELGSERRLRHRQQVEDESDGGDAEQRAGHHTQAGVQQRLGRVHAVGDAESRRLDEPFPAYLSRRVVVDVRPEQLECDAVELAIGAFDPRADDERNDDKPAEDDHSESSERDHQSSPRPAMAVGVSAGCPSISDSTAAGSRAYRLITAVNSS